jgi:8-oxo-dGTP diphosphatase
MKSRDQKLLEEAYRIVIESQTNWGSPQQPYWRPGSNPTVDLVLLYNNKILLIKRGSNSAEANKWAIPGGFIDTTSKKGEPFRMDKEQPSDAAMREVKEETGLDLASNRDLESRMKEIGVYEGENRDPRDNKEAWSKSYVFGLILTDNDGINVDRAKGSDDASDAHWFDIDKLPSQLAFDHGKIIKDALTKLL